MLLLLLMLVLLMLLLTSSPLSPQPVLPAGGRPVPCDAGVCSCCVLLLRVRAVVLLRCASVVVLVLSCSC